MDKIACASDQAFCLAALLSDGRFSLANEVKHRCAASQFDFRCILIHVGRLASQGQTDFVYVEDNQTEGVLECDGDSEGESDTGASDDDASDGGYHQDEHQDSGSNDSDESESDNEPEEGRSCNIIIVH